jgi:hypothetical protein
VAALALVVRARARRSGRSGLRKIAGAITALVLLQIALGGMTVLSRKDALITTGHVAAGALILGTSLLLVLASRRAGAGAAVAGARRAGTNRASSTALAAEGRDMRQVRLLQTPAATKTGREAVA